MKPTTPSSKFARYATASAAALGATAAAEAQFTGSYDVTPPAAATFTAGSVLGTFGNWTGAGSQLIGHSVTTSGTQLDLSWSGLEGSPGSPTYTFTTLAASASTVDFDWTGSTTLTGFEGYLVNGTPTFLSGAGGHVSFAIGVGQTFGFEIGYNYTVGTGSAALTITNFSVAAVPEPGVSSLLAGCAMLGFVGLVGLRKARQRAA